MDNTCNPGLSINSLRKGKTSHDLSWDVEVIAKKAISKTKTKHRTAAECNLQVWSHVSLVPKKGQTYFNHAVEAGPTSMQPSVFRMTAIRQPGYGGCTRI